MRALFSVIRSRQRCKSSYPSTATNSGARRSKFTDAQLVAAAAGRRAVAGGPVYVLAGASRVWTAPAAGLKPGDSVAIESRDGDSGKLIAASVVIRP